MKQRYYFFQLPYLLQFVLQTVRNQGGHLKPRAPRRGAGREPGTCSQAAGAAFLPDKGKRACFQNTDKSPKKLCSACDVM